MFAKRLSKAATSVSAAGDVAGAGVRRHKASQTERDTVRGASRGGGGEVDQAKNCFYALAFSMCVSLRVPFDLLALLFSTCDSDTLELVICPPHPTSPAPLHLVHHFPYCFCVHKSCGMTESHSVMQPQHLMPLLPPPTASLWFFGQFKQML